MVAWSYSVLDGFETCPRRHYFTKVTKEVKEQQTDQMLHGNRVHKALELRIKSNTPLPADMVSYEPFAARMLQAAQGGKIEAEQKLALDPQFRPVSFFDKSTWVRGITDVTIIKGKIGAVFDWKTGNPKPESAQLRLTAAMTFAHHPYLETIHNSFLWLKTGQTTPETFHKEDVPAIWQEFMPRVRRLELAVAENKWPAKPSGLCRKHCPVPRAKCEHSGG